MLKSKKKIAAVTFATPSLLAVTVAGFAQKHLMSAVARPEVKVQLSASVERDSALVPLEKATPDGLRNHLKAEIDRWTPIIRKAGIYAD